MRATTVDTVTTVTSGPSVTRVSSASNNNDPRYKKGIVFDEPDQHSGSFDLSHSVQSTNDSYSSNSFMVLDSVSPTNPWTDDDVSNQYSGTTPPEFKTPLRTTTWLPAIESTIHVNVPNEIVFRSGDCVHIPLNFIIKLHRPSKQ